MKRYAVFDDNAKTYDRWFDTHPHEYAAELKAIRRLLPQGGYGLEVGSGTGRFTQPLSIDVGLEPSRSMQAIAKDRGIIMVDAVAEALPFDDGSFDKILYVTTLCFLDDLPRAFGEAFRVLKDSGVIVIGTINTDSALGQQFLQSKADHLFYRGAMFHSIPALMAQLKAAGFIPAQCVQTLFEPVTSVSSNIPVQAGCDAGLFVVLSADKRLRPATVPGMS